MAFRKADGTLVVNKEAPVVGHYATHNPRRDAIERAFNKSKPVARPAPLAKVDGRRPTPDPKNHAHVALKCHAYVMGCDRRPGLILPFLANQTHTLFISQDYPPPPDLKPIAPQYSQGSPLLSNWRVYRGHQDICKRFLATKDDHCLIFEDDAVPNTADWPNVVNECLHTMPTLGLNVFALYGRSFTPRRFKTVHTTDDNRRVLRLDDPTADPHARGGKHHVYGTLAYLVNRRGAAIISRLQWKGIPCDVEFYDENEFGFLDPSPFNHDRSQGSLLFPASCPPRKK